MDEGYKLIYSGFQIILNNWLYQVLFSWKWWLVVSISIIPWIATYFYLKKEKRKQYFISSLLIMVISSFLDITGLSYDLWRYYVTPLPVMGGFFPWNFSIIPVFYILAFELLPKWSPILKGIIVSLMFAFIGEPIADYLGLTVHHHWKHLYSAPLYFGIYLIAFYGGVILSKKQRNSKSEPEVLNLTDKYQYAFEHSYDAIYLIEKKHWELNFRFTEVNDSFCKELGYTREEVMRLDPRLISDQKSYNVDVKYRPLLKKGSMEIDTTFIKKSGEKKYVSLKVKVFWRKDKIEILSIVNFLENKITDIEAN